MSQVRLILALHNHQPVGNFDGVFEEAYRTGYLPFLDVLEGYPEIPFVLHTSGPLLEWLVERRPEYIERLRRMVEAGRVEILGGGVLRADPDDDPAPGPAWGRSASYSRYLEETLGARVRGMWVAERVWEQHLVSAIAEAGIEYTILDDCPLPPRRLPGGRGPRLLPHRGRRPAAQGLPRLRDAPLQIPFHEPHATYEFLRRLAERRPGATVVFADDGEKFGSWPETYDHVYTQGWLSQFCDMLLANRDWLETTTLRRAVDATLPAGKIYLPDGSYREMTEWALPPDAAAAYKRASRRVEAIEDGGEVERFFRAGGFWRNFKAKYAESDEMYARMLAVSRRLAATRGRRLGRPRLPGRRAAGALSRPVQLPLLARLVRRPLSAPPAERDLPQPDRRRQRARRRRGPDRPAGRARGRRLQPRRPPGGPPGERPADRAGPPGAGGPVYELDVRRCATTCWRRSTAAPSPITRRSARRRPGWPTARGGQPGANRPPTAPARSLKQQGLEDLLVYDSHPARRWSITSTRST